MKTELDVQVRVFYQRIENMFLYYNRIMTYTCLCARRNKRYIIYIRWIGRCQKRKSYTYLQVPRPLLSFLHIPRLKFPINAARIRAYSICSLTHAVNSTKVYQSRYPLHKFPFTILLKNTLHITFLQYCRDSYIHLQSTHRAKQSEKQIPFNIYSYTRKYVSTISLRVEYVTLISGFN